MTSFTRAEVATHNTEADCWLIIDHQVYDVTKFIKFHPGGRGPVLRAAGQDVTEDFHLLHSPAVLRKYQRFVVGTVEGLSAPTEPVPPKGEDERRFFGDLVPYGDPNWYQGWHNPNYNESHRVFRKTVRAFVDKEIVPFVHRWDENKKIPKEVFKKIADQGWLPMLVGPPWQSKYAGPMKSGGVTPEQFDPFHELILHDEFCRPGSGGLNWGLFAGITIGLPPVVHFGSPALQQRVVPSCLNGDKVICLAITEPYAGSDVANIRSTAVKTPCGKFYIVNGEKKWITNGVFADYFTVAVRTGGKGMGGISLLLLERGMEGLETKQMNCTGVWSSGTTYVTMENVKVPVENLLGKENGGFKCIMHNFNHERWWFVIAAVRFARVCLEESIKYAYKRKTFGKRLIDHPVIREKIAEMARQVEATQAWLEQGTLQLKLTPHEDQMKLGGPLALMKVQATRTFNYCSDASIQIFGGNAYTRGGMGEKIERLGRDLRAYAIPGGSEEIMRDRGARQAMKQITKLNSSL